MVIASQTVEAWGPFFNMVIASQTVEADGPLNLAVRIMDSTFGTNTYGFSLLTLSVADERGQGGPSGFVITRAENEASLPVWWHDHSAGAHPGWGALPPSVGDVRLLRHNPRVCTVCTFDAVLCKLES